MFSALVEQDMLHIAYQTIQLHQRSQGRRKGAAYSLRHRNNYGAMRHSSPRSIRCDEHWKGDSQPDNLPQRSDRLTRLRLIDDRVFRSPGWARTSDWITMNRELQRPEPDAT
ncbi:MAG: hypothetical protein EA424_15255 [Planctomycetaceae bacterium]|nr:MAG: hypothetical protein EA424_15255 [Planctomycetaceae bacterium]